MFCSVPVLALLTDHSKVKVKIRNYVHVLTVFKNQTYNFSSVQGLHVLLRNNILLQRARFYLRFLILNDFASCFIVTGTTNKTTMRTGSTVYLQDKGLHVSLKDSYLVTIAVFSEFFTLTLSLTGNLFRIVDAVRSCRMGPIATNPLLMLARNVPFKAVNSCSLHCETSQRCNHCTPSTVNSINSTLLNI